MKSARDPLAGLSPVKRAIVELREMRARLEQMESQQREPIAIIGIGCRFPGGCDGPESYWKLLRDGVDAIREVPADRWDASALYDPDPDAPGKMSTRHGGFLERVDGFDPDFFGIAPREAIGMDPQQRLLLEVCWEALENAGQAPSRLARSRTGVFVGIGSFDYAVLRAKLVEDDIDAYMATGVSHSVASGRLSYLLGLEGPALSLDTACSSSLVAAHLACASLRVDECRLALCGGVNLILSPELHIALSKARMMAPDGRCKAFSAAADGFARSEGCGIIVLKKLRDALEDCDPIVAVIRGSAVTQDGRSSGLTAPNGPSQQTVIRDALSAAGLAPSQLQYVEAHGTGTSLGDPIEVQALAAALGAGRAADAPLRIGSVKTNLGHMETAAGIAGLIKAALSVQHAEIPPHLHLDEPSPHIPWSEIPVRAQAEGSPWPESSGPRRAGVSSFGFSGTNAHVIVEQAPEHKLPVEDCARPLHLWTLSARSEQALAELRGRHAVWLERHSTASLADVAFTVNAGRSHFEHRLAITAATTAELARKLSRPSGQAESGTYSACVADRVASQPVFMFTGQGCQYAGMGRRLCETQPTFRAALEQCEELLRPHLELPLLSVLFGKAAEAQLDQTAYTQPAIFAFEYAMAELLRSWGIEPAAVIGHSVGEYVAACVAGVFSLEDGLKLIAQRGRSMQALPSGGAMAAILADEDRVGTAIAAHRDTVSIAAINGPAHTVISGDAAVVEQILADFERDRVTAIPLRVSHAFHSPLIEPAVAELRRIASDIRFSAPQLPMITNLPGQDVAGVDYWCRQAREAVRFSEGLEALEAEGHRLFVELGPQPILCGIGRKCISGDQVRWQPTLQSGRDDWESLLESVASLHVEGVEIDWEGFDRDYPRRKLALPTYAFQRERCWLDTQPAQPQLGSDQRWERLADTARRQSEHIPIDLALHSYADKWELLDRLTTAYIVRTFRSLGAYQQPGQAYSADELLERHGILPAYRHLVARWLDKLAGHSILERRDGRFASQQPLTEVPLAPLLAEAKRDHTDIQFLFDYLQRCGDLLKEVLTGEQSALETLFPGGSFDTAEQLYHGWALSRYYNGIAASAIRQLTADLDPGRGLRILEIGAGTGGTTASILPILPLGRSEYHYTDISEFFFGEAKRRFAGYPFMRYGMLDIEKDPAEQGYPAQSFDVITASNVLHATRDLRGTLDRVRSLLVPGGLLVIYETTHHPTWFDVTIGLIEGWQLFEDDLRGDNPLISRSQWEQLLADQGFDRVTSLPESGSSAEVLPQHVLIARAPDDGSSPGRSVAARGTDTVAPASIPEEPDVVSENEQLQRLQAARPDERAEILVDFTRRQVNRVLRRDPTRHVDRQHRLMDLGVDSLMAVELRNVLGEGLGLAEPLPATLIFDYPTVEAIARLLGEQLFGQPAGKGAGEEPPAANSVSVGAREIEELPDAEVERMLAEKLDREGRRE